jgi:3-hydroxybutyryl-CoA dehydrogenase
MAMGPASTKTNLNIIAVVGAGTMGSGIALAALLSGLRTILYDIDQALLSKARDYIEGHLQRKQRAINIKYLKLSSDLNALQTAGVVIEAIPEDLRLKQELFSRLDQICPPPAVLATNTSTLSVTAISGAVTTPERVAGMHFFNPAPVLPLVEVVRGARSSPTTVQSLVDLAKKLGKTPVVAGDTPGFIVNRVARPFYGESLRLLGEGTAQHAQIDRLLREAGGFKMGPFELMDLIGIDINFTATQSMYEQTFLEPRYRPHILQARMVQDKALGRKTGRGFYTYDTSPPRNEISPNQATPLAQGNKILISNGSWVPGLAGVCREAGFGVEIVPIEDYLRIEIIPRAAAGVVTAGKQEGLAQAITGLERLLEPDTPLFVQCADVTLAEVSTYATHPQRLIGFDGLFFSNEPTATLVASPGLSQQGQQTALSFLAAMGKSGEWVQDSPGLVLPRVICMLANEAAFVLGEGVADEATIDLAMQLGTNYPKGPLEWAANLGYNRVVTVLEHLYQEYGEERYRIAPLLKRWARWEGIKE